MLKRLLIIILTLLCVFSFAGEAFAAGTKQQYTVDASANNVSHKGTITFAKTPAGQVLRAKGYIGGGQRAEATPVSSNLDAEARTVAIKFEEAGNSKATLKANSESGERLKQVPVDTIAVKVTPLPPVTEPPIILDCDRVVLLGEPPQECGVKQKEHGFYMGTNRHDLKTKVKSNKIIRGKTNKLVTGLKPDTMYYYRAYTVTSGGTVYGDTARFITPPEKRLAAKDAVFQNPPGRYMYLFGSTDKYYKLISPPFGYVGKAEASKQMVTIKVPVWKIKRGKKVSETMPVTINYKLEDNVKAIFGEIHELDIKFPVMDLKGYSYRRISGPGLEGSPIMSHHSFGAAIDVNKPYNQFYKYRDKRNRKSPYYIPRPVIDIFEKYGWAWGGDFKEGLDTMHFQYLGLDLTK